MLYFGCRRTADNKVEADYRIRLSGDEIEKAQTLNQTTASDTDLLQEVLNTLSTSELANDRASNIPIEGQRK